MPTPEYSIEPELQHSPRMIRRRGTRGYGAVFCQWLLIPPLCGLTLFMLLWSLHMALVRITGPIVPCRIVERYVKYDEHDNQLHYLVYRYTFYGREYSSRELVEQDLYTQKPVASTSMVQLSPLWPELDPVLRVPGRNVWATVWLLGFCAFVMMAGVAALAYYLFIPPIRQRRLILYGVPVRGRLVDKTEFIGARSQSFYLHYEYQPEATMNSFVQRQNVRLSDWNKAAIGDSCTILYDREKPEFSLIYQYSDYEVI
jgi:hypothetical protein